MGIKINMGNKCSSNLLHICATNWLLIRECRYPANPLDLKISVGSLPHFVNFPHQKKQPEVCWREPQVSKLAQHRVVHESNHVSNEVSIQSRMRCTGIRLTSNCAARVRRATHMTRMTNFRSVAKTNVITPQTHCFTLCKKFSDQCVICVMVKIRAAKHWTIT